MTKDKVLKAIEENVTGVWVAAHDERGHHYRHRPTGILVDSVTTKNILEKEHLRPWAIRVALEWLEDDDRWNKYVNRKKQGAEKNEYLQGAILAHTSIRDDAGTVGSYVHDAAEGYIKEWIATGTKPDDIIRFLDPNRDTSDGRIIAGVRSIKKLFDDRPDVIPVASELLVGDVGLNSAGTLDLLVLNKGELELWDFKTSNSVDPIGYSMQIAAYSYMFQKMTKLKPKRWKVVKISKDYDKVDIYRLVGYKEALETFKRLSGVYDRVKRRAFTLERDVKRIVLS